MDMRFYDNGSKLNPLSYSNGKNQADVIEEVLDAFKDDDIVFLKATVGSGKSPIAIRTALEYGRGVVSVPTKALSRQYMNDYCKGDKYFLDEKGDKAEIKMLQGRSNFQCPHLESKKPSAPKWRKNCQSSKLPCSRPLAQNESRKEALEDCRWAGKVDRELKMPGEFFDYGEQYMSLAGGKTVLLKEGPGGDFCPYWEQYCLPEDTGVLVPGKIKNIKELSVGDKIYSMNENEEVEIDRIKNITKRKADDEDFFRFYSENCNLLASGNHKIYFKKEYGNEEVHKDKSKRIEKNKPNHGWVVLKPTSLPYKESEETILSLAENAGIELPPKSWLNTKEGEMYWNDKMTLSEIGKELGVSRKTISRRLERQNIPIRSSWKERSIYKGLGIAESMGIKDFMRLLGWYISEGSISKSEKRNPTKIQIGCTGSFKEDVKSLLDKNQLTFYEREDRVVVSNLALSIMLRYYGGEGFAREKKINHELFSLPKKNLIELFEGIADGDGYRRNESNIVFSTISSRLADDLVWLSYHLGNPANHLGNPATKAEGNCFYISSKKPREETAFNIKKEKYTGKVYDISIEKNDNFFAGNEGKFILVSNSSFARSDVSVLNSMKMKIETYIGRLPDVPLIIVDESDLFLDQLCSKVTLSSRKIKNLKEEIIENGGGKIMISGVDKTWKSLLNEEMEPLGAVGRLKQILEDAEWDCSLFWKLSEIMRHAEDCSLEDNRDNSRNPSIKFIIPNPEPIFKQLERKLDAKILLMSATRQSRAVLNDIFGIDPAFVEGEIEYPGTLIQRKTGDEVKVNYDKWNGDGFKAKYARVRDSILRRAERPAFVPVHATKYLPSSIDSDEITRNTTMEKRGVSYSTKLDRGADLGEMESVILLKYPFPSLGDPLLRAQKRSMDKSEFWDYYRDQARRAFIQQIGRITRSPDTVAEFWSPDQTAHEELDKNWEGTIKRRVAQDGK